MNIFYLHTDPEWAASMHCDKHVVKMILESAQLLSTAHRLLDGVMSVELSEKGRKRKVWTLSDRREPILYKASHINHPSAKWVRESNFNYVWLYRLLDNLCTQYTSRYYKLHKVERDGLLLHLYRLPRNIPITHATPIPQCMPDEFKVDGDPVKAYRNYYMGHKVEMKKWNHSLTPEWWQENMTEWMFN